MSLRVGFGAADVTPPPGLPMGGYAARQSPATGTLDSLACRAAVFSDGGGALVIAVADLLCVSAPWADVVRARIADAVATEPARVLLAATHTHAAPALFPPPAAAPAALDRYRERVADALVDAARTALDAAEDATPYAGSAPVRGVAANRRDPRQPVDECVRVLGGRRRDGTWAGVVAAFGCHPTVLSASNLAYSRDLFGAAADAAEAAIGAPVVLLNGAAGDVSTRFTRGAQSAGEVVRLGAILGAGIDAALRAAEPLADAPLAGEVGRVPVRLRPLPAADTASAALTRAAQALDSARAGGAAGGDLRLATARLEGAAAQLHLAQAGGWGALLGRQPEHAEVQCLRLGGLRLLAAPGEIFSAAGGRLGRAAPAIVAGYANDYLGYLVPPEDAAEGEYESLMAAVEPQSAAAIEAALAEMGGHG